MARKRNNERTLGWSTRVNVPEQIREWVRTENMVNKANGQKCISLMFVIDAVLKAAEKQFPEIIEGVPMEELVDTRGRPKSNTMQES